MPIRLLLKFRISVDLAELLFLIKRTWGIPHRNISPNRYSLCGLPLKGSSDMHFTSLSSTRPCASLMRSQPGNIWWKTEWTLWRLWFQDWGLRMAAAFEINKQTDFRIAGSVEGIGGKLSWQLFSHAPLCSFCSTPATPAWIAPLPLCFCLHLAFPHTQRAMTLCSFRGRKYTSSGCGPEVNLWHLLLEGTDACQLYVSYGEVNWVQLNSCEIYANAYHILKKYKQNKI